MGLCQLALHLPYHRLNGVLGGSYGVSVSVELFLETVNGTLVISDL